MNFSPNESYQTTVVVSQTSADEATSSAAPPAISQQFDIVQTSPSLIPVKGAPINTTQIAADLHIQSQEVGYVFFLCFS